MLGDDDLTVYQDHANDRGVYIVTCTPTGSKYVGSSGAVKSRWVGHASRLRHGKGTVKMQAEWDAHGELAFTFELVEYVADPADLEAREQAWIDGDGTLNRLSSRVGRPGRLHVHSDETFERTRNRIEERAMFREWATLEVAEEWRAARRFTPNRYASDQERYEYRKAFDSAVEIRLSQITARQLAS